MSLRCFRPRLLRSHPLRPDDQGGRRLLSQTRLHPGSNFAREDANLSDAAVISDPNHPDFDLEKYLIKVSKENP